MPRVLKRPPAVLGVLAAALAVAAVTALLYPLKSLAPAISLGVLYLVAVLLVASVWGMWLGALTAIASALAFNFFHIPPTGRFTIREAQDWVALAVFLVAALVTGSLADMTRATAIEAEERRREADLAAELARVILGTDDLDAALGPAAQRIAQALGLPSVAIHLSEADPGPREVAIPVTDGDRRLATVLVGAAVPRERLERAVVPTLAALLRAAEDRSALLGEVVETRALRRSEGIKTTLLRAVSHDLRTPLTGIVASAEALGSDGLEGGERRELAAGIATEARRLSSIVDNLLDLSRLEAQRAEPRRSWVALDEVLDAAAEGLERDRVELRLDEGLPLLHADPSQLERVFHNLLENALEHSGTEPVQVRARVVGARMMIRVMDRGPGIPATEQGRIFEPFYRAPAGHRRSAGSGLGLAIVRGFVEANGGTVTVESLPGQGAAFAIALPLVEGAR